MTLFKTDFIIRNVNFVSNGNAYLSFSYSLYSSGFKPFTNLSTKDDKRPNHNMPKQITRFYATHFKVKNS